MKKKRNLTLIIGAVLTAFMLLFLLIGFFYTPYDPDAMNGAAKFAAPSLSHPFGCDHFGRDIFSRVLKGTGTTFFVAFATLLLGGTIGVLVGAFTGYFGGWIDEILMRINDVIVSFPGILLALVFIALLGPGKYNVILALGIVFIPSFARITRSEFLARKDMDYVKSARLMGVSHLRIIFVHILPNTVPSLLSMAAIGFNNAVLSEAGMSFLGIGVLVGAFTGYFGGWIDEILMRINDVIVSFPGILLALVFIALLGPGKYNVILALGIVFIPSFARITRSEFLARKDMDYVKSARLMGVSHLRIIFVHILPNTVPSLLSMAAIGFNNAVLSEAGMSFLGIGVQPPDASLGRMLSESQTYLMTAPWGSVFPGLAVILLALGVSLLGDGLQKKGGN